MADRAGNYFQPAIGRVELQHVKVDMAYIRYRRMHLTAMITDVSVEMHVKIEQLLGKGRQSNIGPIIGCQVYQHPYDSLICPCFLERY